MLCMYAWEIQLSKTHPFENECRTQRMPGTPSILRTKPWFWCYSMYRMIVENTILYIHFKQVLGTSPRTANGRDISILYTLKWHEIWHKGSGKKGRAWVRLFGIWITCLKQEKNNIYVLLIYTYITVEKQKYSTQRNYSIKTFTVRFCYHSKTKWQLPPQPFSWLVWWTTTIMIWQRMGLSDRNQPYEWGILSRY